MIAAANSALYGIDRLRASASPPLPIRSTSHGTCRCSLLVRNCDKPYAIYIIDSVIMKVGRRDAIVRMPEKNPSTIDEKSGSKMTNATTLAEGTALSPPGPAANGCSNKTPQKHAAHSAMYPTDRSISPHNRTNVSPTDTIPSTAPCCKTW